MKIIANGPGIMADFTKAIGATVRGRFIDIPASKGGGYITGFGWGNDLRVMIRNYHLKEEVFVEWTNEAMREQKHVVFLLSGVFPSPIHVDEELVAERAHVLICSQVVSSIINMPSNTMFGSVTIGVSRQYLHQLFGHINNPAVTSVLEAKGNFMLEMAISPEMISAASGIIHLPVPESLENHYCKLKCEELLCHIFSLLMQREDLPTNGIHIDDIKAIYAIKIKLQSKLDEPPNIASLAVEAGMSEPKMRKLFKQTFGKGVFEYFQSARMQEAAMLLKEKRLTVSEVGYRLGFTNLSHFSRVFEQHIGIKPKKYSALEVS